MRSFCSARLVVAPARVLRSKTPPGTLLPAKRVRSVRALRSRVVSSGAQAPRPSQHEESAASAALSYGAAALSTIADRVSALSLDTAAELSRIQAERFKTLSNLPVDPLSTLQKLASDVQQQPLPHISLTDYVQDFEGEVQRRVHASDRSNVGGGDLTDEEREHVLPEIPPVPDAMLSLQSDIAETRAKLKMYAQQQRQQDVAQ